jgi:CRP-like cAMP-binding protein
LSNRPIVQVNNRLLDMLPEYDRQKLLAYCEDIKLVFNDVLYLAGESIPHVYFPTGSFISLLTPINGSSNLEVGLIGNEGMLGITLILDVQTAPFHALVQGAGSALRIRTEIFLRIIEQSSVIKNVFKRFLYVSFKQLAQTAGCTRFHVVEARLARWLLMTQDRAHSENFHVTHIFLAYILGVRRVGITKAANSLQKQKLIRYRRGDVTILDRKGLLAASCLCYEADLASYQQILG